MSILDFIGNTPLIEIDGIYVKLEYLNPSGSVKDRIAKYIVEKAEQTGKLKKGYTIVEASTGNTGTALSLVGAVKGYKVIIYIARGLTEERYKMMRAFGAELRFVPKDRTDMAVQKAAALGRKPKFYHTNQFANAWNAEEHQNYMGQEILRQLKGKKIDAVVTGIGSGGTIIGLARALKRKNPRLKVYGVEPAKCALTYEHLHNMRSVCRPHKIEGIADGFVPPLVYKNFHLIDGIIRIDDRAAIKEAKRIARVHGCFVGVCSGANLLAARKIKKEKKFSTVVTLFTDEGEKYLSEKWFA
jgi:cysteine synthase A